VSQLLIIILGALVLGAAAIWLMQQDQGYVLISLGTTSIEMSFWLAAIIFVASSGVLIWLMLLLRWLFGVGGVRQWWVARRMAKQSYKTATGMLDFICGDWQAATGVLQQAVKDPVLSQVNLLFAAKAAANNQQLDESRQILERLGADYPDHKVYADLVLAECLIEVSALDEAEQFLLAITAEHKMTLRLLSEIYRLKSNWFALNDLMPKLKRQAVMDAEAFKALQIDCYCGLLGTIDKSLPANIKAEKLEVIWSDMPRAFRKIPEVVAAYVNGLAATDASEKALLVLSKVLKNQWHYKLVEAYGLLELKDAAKQLAIGEQWLAKYADDALLLFALGRICRRMGFLGKAKDYMQSTIARKPSVQAYNELAAILELLGDHTSASDMYRQGLRFVTQPKASKH